MERLRKALFLLNNEKEFLKLHTKIKTEVEAKMTKQQREYMLKEQLKSIKKELGYEKVTLHHMARGLIDERTVESFAILRCIHHPSLMLFLKVTKNDNMITMSLFPLSFHNKG